MEHLTKIFKNNQPILRTLLNNKTLTQSSPCFIGTSHTHRLHSHPEPPPQAAFIQNLLKFRRDKPTDQIEQALSMSKVLPNDNLVLEVLQRHRSDWRPAFVFFNWASKNCTPTSQVYNQILDILGKMKRFQELHQLLDEMSQIKGLINEDTFSSLIRRLAGAHKVDEAIDMFYKREQFGLQVNLEAFNTLLMWLGKYKHVEEAETLFHTKLNELGFCHDIKTWNVILSGWCVLGNVREAKRVWKDILRSKCKPDNVTYATFIKALINQGKLGTALKLFRGIWDEGCTDVVICNCIIDALCFKKRVPEALELFHDMKERGCELTVATFNTLIKHLCKIRRMEKVYELFEDMERRKGSCLPNQTTYSFLLKSLREPKEVREVLERMETNGCRMSDDIYNLVLRLSMKWNDQDGLRRTWDEMERNGLGPDRRSYTIMIHGHFEKGRITDGMRYFREMKSKGIEPEPRTEKLLNSMNIQLKERMGIEVETSSS